MSAEIPDIEDVDEVKPCKYVQYPYSRSLEKCKKYVFFFSKGFLSGLLLVNPLSFGSTIKSLIIRGSILCS